VLVRGWDVHVSVWYNRLSIGLEHQQNVRALCENAYFKEKCGGRFGRRAATLQQAFLRIHVRKCVQCSV